MRAPPVKLCPTCGERYDPDELFCSRDGTPLTFAHNPAATRTSSPDTDPYLGLELAGQITLRHLIGIGSMGRVYRAWQGGIERDVAVKILHRELAGNAELVKRFHREAKVASRLVHANVVQVLMTGTIPFAAPSAILGAPFLGGELYLVMEHLDGMSLLSALVAAGTSGEAQALPLPRALHIAVQLCDAVGEAHAQKIVHRDLKPENVMLVRRADDRDYVKVLDFGIARLDWADKGMETQAGRIFGTAKYISPEGAEGLAVGPEGDVYAIATMLYQMLAGRTPFEGDSPVALLVQHAHTPPTDLREIARASYVPAPIAAVVMQNLSKKAEDRAASARALGRDLVAAARASGLFPEEFASQGALVSAGIGGVKLASNQRTKTLELSVDLAGKIGGVAAPPRASKTPPPDDAPISREGPPSLPRPVSSAGIEVSLASLASGEAGASRPSRSRPPESVRTRPPIAIPSSRSEPIRKRGDVPPSGDGLTRVSIADLDFDDSASSRSAARARVRVEAPEDGADLRDGEDPGSSDGAAPGDRTVEAPPLFNPTPGTSPTIQGTEKALLPRPPALPSKPTWRGPVLAIAAIAVAALLLVVGSRRMAGAGDARGGEEAVEEVLERGRAAMRKHAWTSPSPNNVKEVLDAASAKWPGDGRVKDARREAAEMLVSDALGRKYADDVTEALRLANLALELDPSSNTARRLVGELAGAAPSAAATVARDPEEPHADAPPPPPKVRRVPLLRPPVSAALAPPLPSATASASPRVPTAVDKPVPPASTGPWL